MKIDVKTLSYKERLQLLKDLFDNTNIVLTAAYGHTATISGIDLDFVMKEEAPRDKNGGRPYCREDFDSDDKDAPELIIIYTGICTG